MIQGEQGKTNWETYPNESIKTKYIKKHIQVNRYKLYRSINRNLKIPRYNLPRYGRGRQGRIQVIVNYSSNNQHSRGGGGYQNNISD